MKYEQGPAIVSGTGSGVNLIKILKGLLKNPATREYAFRDTRPAPKIMRPGHLITILLGCGILITPPALSAAPAPPEGQRLRELTADNFPSGTVYFGGTTGWRGLDGDHGTVMAREFSYVTPENAFKQHDIHPAPGIWRWEHAKTWIKFAEKHGQTMRVHGPVSPQCSAWAKADSRTAQELRENMHAYMTALCKHIDPIECIRWMDVVNEILVSDGRWHGPKPGTDKWENPWPKMGFDESVPLRPPLYVKEAFQISNKHAPNKKQIINQHGGMQPALWDKIKATVDYLKNQDLRVDGLGWQAHIKVGFEKEKGNLENLRELIRWTHTRKMSFHITEMNVWIKDPEDPAMLKAQADTFSAVIRVLLEEREGGEVTWNTWNLREREVNKKRNRHGCLFNDDFSPRPAYYAVQKMLGQPPAAGAE